MSISTLKNITILVVEDSQPTASLMTSILKAHGCETVLIASNGKMGFDIFRRAHPEIVITDWSMELANGLELVDMIRKDPISPNPLVPIIMVTGHRRKIQVTTARDMGINEFLIKPFTPSDLVSRVVYTLENPRTFVKAKKFFGPDRRRKRPEDISVPKRRQEDIEKDKAEIIDKEVETVDDKI